MIHLFGLSQFYKWSTRCLYRYRLIQHRRASLETRALVSSEGCLQNSLALNHLKTDRDAGKLVVTF